MRFRGWGAAWGMAGLLAVAMLGRSEEAQRMELKQVAVRVENNITASPAVRGLAQLMASRIFASIGVKIVWKPPADVRNVIEVRLQRETPEEFLPGALGYANPFEISAPRVYVLYDRVVATNARSRLGYILGHVIAHELAHAIERCDCHAGEGVLKAHWAARDLAQMEFEPLGFTESDAVLIRAGLPLR